MNRNHYSSYVALGDSISIDVYPAKDLAETRGTRVGSPEVAGLGAASLFLRNREEVWPEFAGRDLVSLTAVEESGSIDVTADGATTWDVLDRQLPNVERSDASTLVTLTAGGNDILTLLVAGNRVPDRKLLVSAVPRNLEEIVRRVRVRRPNSTIVMGTIYDPSDGSDRLPLTLSAEPLPLEGSWLRETNEAIRALAARCNVRLADIHRHFLGHGWQSEECWFWRGLIFEPSARGASEVRRLWLEASGLESEGNRS